MPRKAKGLKPRPTSSATPGLSQIPDPGGEAVSGPSAPEAALPPKRKPGRPSKVELEARRLAERQARQISPEAAFPVTKALLYAMAVVIKGDEATDAETKTVNVAMVDVMNRYSVEFQHMELANLGLALVVTGAGMRKRRKERIAAASDSGDSRPKGERQDRADSALSRFGAEVSGH